MSRRTLVLDDQLYDYLIEKGTREERVLADLRARTGVLTQAGMQISPEQGQLMRLLIRMLGARNTIEVGTFTGYSALCVALELPDDGRVVACDVSEEWTSIGREAWERAGVAHRIDLRLAPALQTLDALAAEGRAGTFDFAFIDADKENYVAYYERCLKLVRAGGLIAIDNVLWSGAVARPDVQNESTNAIRAINDLVANDARVDISMIPIGDGLTLARVRKA
jgi:caffeoyl-CoA O-methyltransferase